MFQINLFPVVRHVITSHVSHVNPFPVELPLFILHMPQINLFSVVRHGIKGHVSHSHMSQFNLFSVERPRYMAGSYTLIHIDGIYICPTLHHPQVVWRIATN